MFSKQTYINRRNQLRLQFKTGVLLFIGNDETGMNYKVEAFSVVIYPKNMGADKMETRRYPLAPGTIDTIEKEKK